MLEVLRKLKLSSWIDNFDDFWEKRGSIARVLRNTTEATSFQWNWPANRRDNSICVEHCDDPYTGRSLSFEEGMHLIAEALENYKKTDWNFKQKGEFESATFEVYLLDIRTKAQKIYVKIAVKENVLLRNLVSGETYTGTRVKLWSFHPPRK